MSVEDEGVVHFSSVDRACGNSYEFTRTLGSTALPTAKSISV